MDNIIPSISSLHAERNKKNVDTQDIYKIVLNKCTEKIIFTNRHTDKTFIIFEVPKLLIGHSNYNMKSCIHYIIQNISMHGYVVQFIEPFYIYIDWGTKKNYNTNLKSNFDSNFDSTSNSLQENTKQILKYFPGVKEIEYVYADKYKSNKQENKKDKSNNKDKDKLKRKKKM